MYNKLIDEIIELTKQGKLLWIKHSQCYYSTVYDKVGYIIGCYSASPYFFEMHVKNQEPLKLNVDQELLDKLFKLLKV